MYGYFHIFDNRNYLLSTNWKTKLSSIKVLRYMIR